jgi:hypothetical protein
VIHAALAGVFLLVCSYATVLLLSAQWPGLAAAWTSRVPFAYSGASLGALLLGMTLWWPLNLVFAKQTEVRRTIGAWNDYWRNCSRIPWGILGRLR